MNVIEPRWILSILLRKCIMTEIQSTEMRYTEPRSGWGLAVLPRALFHPQARYHLYPAHSNSDLSYFRLSGLILTTVLFRITPGSRSLRSYLCIVLAVVIAYTSLCLLWTHVLVFHISDDCFSLSCVLFESTRSTTVHG